MSLTKTSLVQAFLRQIFLIQAFLAQIPLVLASSAQISLISAFLAALVLVKYKSKKLKKLLEQVNKFDTLTDKNIEITRLLKRDICKIIIFKKFVTLDKAVIFEKISNNI